VTICRFENRIKGTALALEKPVDHLVVSQPEQLLPVLEQIMDYQKHGFWVALLLDYELGYYLEPALASQIAQLHNKHNHPLLSAHIFQNARMTVPWQMKADESASILKVTPEITEERYNKDIFRIKQLINQGEVYQINYTLNMRLRTSGKPQVLYRNIAHQHPSAYAAYIEDGPRTILSFSPELFMQRRGNTLTCRPMKGTAPRHLDPIQDHHLAQTLYHSEKNRAENLMIVDLMRNDLHRIALPNSVQVPALFTLEAYPSVWTLTSTISAQLAPSTHFYALLQALFPCGSITGAPKIAAMRHLQQLESRSRGLYCGSIGWLAPNGDFSFNIAIRTLILEDQNQGYYAVGGGIVHDSIAEQEWQECFWKARLLQAY